MAVPVYRSKRARILYNLQKTLETLTVTNGYTMDVFKVTTVVKAWRDTPEAETPVIYIVDETTAAPRYHPGKLMEFEWKIGLYCVMKNKSQYEMEEFIADIIECLHNNNTLAHGDMATEDNPNGRQTSHLHITDVITDNQLFSEIEGAQLFKVALTALYTICYPGVR